MLKACYAKKVTIELVFQRNGKRLKDPITGNYTRVYVYKAGYGIYEKLVYSSTCLLRDFRLRSACPNKFGSALACTKISRLLVY